MALLSKPAPVPVDEMERLRRENALLRKKTGIDTNDLQIEQTHAKHQEELESLKRDQKEQWAKEQEKKKQDRIKEINKKFSDNLDKRVRVFQILSNESGRWAEFTTNASCPSCGSDNIPVVPEFKAKTVETLEAYQRDPVLLFEKNIFGSLGNKEFSCRACGHHWTWHYQISI